MVPGWLEVYLQSRKSFVSKTGLLPESLQQSLVVLKMSTGNTYNYKLKIHNHRYRFKSKCTQHTHLGTHLQTYKHTLVNVTHSCLFIKVKCLHFKCDCILNIWSIEQDESNNEDYFITNSWNIFLKIKCHNCERKNNIIHQNEIILITRNIKR